ncbi:MAG: hypothetical protein ACK5CG_18515, partial [Aphanizomenon sp.]
MLSAERTICLPIVSLLKLSHPITTFQISFANFSDNLYTCNSSKSGLPITHYPLPITHYPLPITHYPLPITHYPLPITHYPLPIT